MDAKQTTRQPRKQIITGAIIISLAASYGPSHHNEKTGSTHSQSCDALNNCPDARDSLPSHQRHLEHSILGGLKKIWWPTNN